MGLYENYVGFFFWLFTQGFDKHRFKCSVLKKMQTSHDTVELCRKGIQVKMSWNIVYYATWIFLKPQLLGIAFI